MDQFEINHLKEEVLYHKGVAKMGIKLLDEFMELGPCLSSKQVRKLIDLRKILADATI